MPPKTYQVVPNPYKMLDADGVPIAVYPCHRKHAPGEYVGAKLTIAVLSPAESITIKRKDKRGQTSAQTVQAKAERSKGRFEFTTEPVDLPAHLDVGAYYRAGIVSGVLIAANAATARACGVAFEPVDAVLAREREQAAKAFEREFGEAPAWASATTTKPAPTAQ